MIRERPAGGALAAVLFALSGVGCGTKTVATPPAPEPVVEAAAPEPHRSVGSVVETQNSGPLPVARPVSVEAAPAGPEPLAGEAGRLPKGIGAEPLREGNSADKGGEAPKAATPRGAMPRLGPVLTRDERRQRSRLIDRDLDAARRIVTGIVGRDLTAEQINTVRRIREFLRQTDEARSRDPALARNLADRAALLARDLAASLD
jgi:hypothetical protein